MHMENKGADQILGNGAADQRLCFRFIDSKIPLLLKSKMSSLCPSSVAVQPSLFLTWVRNPQDRFSHDTTDLFSEFRDPPMMLYTG